MPFPLLAPLAAGAAGSLGAYAGNKTLNALFGPSSGNKQEGLQGNFLTGSPAQLQPFTRFNPQQQQAFNQLLSQGMQGLQNPSVGFEPFAQQARRQFQQEVVPSLASQFTANTGGKLSSPLFASQLGSAAGDLESNLAAGQAQFGLNNQRNLLDMLRLGFTPQYEYQGTNESPGVAQGALQSLIPLLPLLTRLFTAYQLQGLNQGESPFFESLNQVLGGAALPKAQ